MRGTWANRGGAEPLKHRGPLAQDQALPWHGWTRPWMPPTTRHCLQTSLTPTAYAPSEAPATCSSCPRWCFLWEHIWQENLLCAEFWVVLGLALTLSANTDIHTEQSGLCGSSTGFGLWQRNRPLLSPLLELEPSQCQGGKTKAFRSRLGGKPTFPSPLFPRDTWCLPGTAEKTSLLPFPNQSTSGVLEVVPACTRASLRSRWNRMPYCAYLYLCLFYIWYVCLYPSVSLLLSVCLCIWGKGPSFRQIIWDIRDPKRVLSSWA